MTREEAMRHQINLRNFFEQKARIADYLNAMNTMRDQMNDAMDVNSDRENTDINFTDEFAPYYKAGKYGRVYGTDIKDWKQTKPAPTGKSFHFKGVTWKYQYIPSDVKMKVLDMNPVTCRFFVNGIFEVDILFEDMDKFAKEAGITPQTLTRANFSEILIKKGLIPYPMEELI